MRLAFAGTFAGRLEPQVRAHLDVPCDILVADEAAIAARLADVDVLVTMAFTAEMGGVAKRLALVQVPGAGLDRIDRAALPAGTWLANAYGHEIGIAEYVIGAMLALTRQFGPLDAALLEGVWHSQWAIGAAPPPAWPELAGKTLGILGYGRIGQALARRARAFDMNVCGIRRTMTGSSADALSWLRGPEALDDLLRAADYLAITLSLNDATRGLLGARELARMKRTAMLLNVARAEIVDEDALYQALKDGVIAGAALDVWYRYPVSAGATVPAHRPFHELPNVLMTPHVSGWTEGMLDARARVIADNVGRAARGLPPVNRIL